MDLVTRALRFVSPSAAFKRARTLQALDLIEKRGYEGASKGRRVKNWRTASTSANAELQSAHVTLRNRSRDLFRNDSWAKRGGEIIVECAAGAVPKPETGNDALDAEIVAAFEEWSQACDAEEDDDFFGLQDQAVQSIVESGDVLMRRRRRRSSDRLAVPLQLQLMEPDHLDASEVRNVGTGLDVVHGIELDRLNRRAAYWLYPTHPGEVGIYRPQGLTSRRIPADQIAHGFRKTRPGQLVGVPWVSSAMIDLRDLGDYEHAEQVRKKIEACLSVFVTTNDPSDLPELGSEGEDDDGPLETLEPGMIEYLKHGEDIQTVNPSPSSGYDAYTRSRLHKIATGMGIPYMLLTGDVSRANWSSYKAGIVPFKQMIRRFQKRVMLRKVCRPAWRWFIDAAYAAGRISEINYGVQWTLPGLEPIDRLKEVMADQMEARIGKTAMQEIIRASGRDPEQVLREIIEWASKTDAAELVFDSDPRKVSNAGLTQARPPGTVVPPTGAPNNEPTE